MWNAIESAWSLTHVLEESTGPTKWGDSGTKPRQTNRPQVLGSGNGGEVATYGVLDEEFYVLEHNCV